MCGIVGAIAERNVVPILMEGLRRLEYRGYDSAGLAVLERPEHLLRPVRTVGKVRALEEALDAARPSRARRHRPYPLGDPWRSQRAQCAPACFATMASRSCTTASSKIMRSCATNSSARATGSLRRPTPKSSRIASTTICDTVGGPVQGGARHGRANSQGAYALAVMSEGSGPPDRRARRVSGRASDSAMGENFVASDVAALLPVTRRFMFLEEGDVAEIRRRSRPDHGPRRQQRRARRPRERAVGRCGREGPVPALHAQGNPRAAARDRQHAQERVANGQPARSGIRPAADRGVQRESKTCTSSPAARAITPAWSRGISSNRSAGMPCARRDRQRISLSQSGGAGRHAVRHHLPIRRNGGHARRAAPWRKQAGYLSTLAICNVAGELAGARIGAGAC